MNRTPADDPSRTTPAQTSAAAPADGTASHSHGDSKRKVVLVTGASGGVGEGIALACGEAGWEVWIAARRRTEGERVAQLVTDAGGLGRFVASDVADAESVRATIDTISDTSGRLDGVVHNATSGLSSVPSAFGEITPEDLESHLSVSVTGLHLLAITAYPLLTQTRGSLVVTTSEAGFEGKARLPAYATVKAAQRGLVRTLAREWGPSGVRANCVAPLAMTDAMERAFELDPSMSDRVLGRLPLRRLGDARKDIGPVVRFLLGDEARYLTGQTIMIDGGSCPIS